MLRIAIWEILNGFRLYLMAWGKDDQLFHYLTVQVSESVQGLGLMNDDWLVCVAKGIDSVSRLSTSS